MPAVHDIPRHPKSAQYASGKVEFRAITMRDDNGETIVTPGISVAKFTNNGTGFTIDLPEGMFESRIRIDGGTKTEWEDGRFINPPGGGRYLTLLQSFTGVPEDPSALEALYAVLAETYAPLGLVADTIVYNADGTPQYQIAGGVRTDYTWNSDGTCHTETSQGKVKTWTYDTSGNPISSIVTEV